MACASGGRGVIVVAGEPRMVFLGFGKFARSDRIYALEPLRGDERATGDARGSGLTVSHSPIIASRTERTILHDMGQDSAAEAPIVAEALDLAGRLAAAADTGHVDLGDLGRRRSPPAGDNDAPGRRGRLADAAPIGAAPPTAAAGPSCRRRSRRARPSPPPRRA